MARAQQGTGTARGAPDPAGANRLTDGELLGRFVAGRDEAAFEELLRRHGPMVLGVCRRILYDVNDAEDAFQATFLALLRQAGSINKRESVGSWLYGVAYRIAVKAKSRARRRRTHERRGVAMPAEDPLYEAIWRDLRPVLDEEVNGLPAKYRRPVVLCYLEGKPYAEAARELRCSKGTVCLRLARARELLRQRLARRDVVLSAGLFLALMEQRRALVRVPAGLMAATGRAAWLWWAAEEALRSGGGTAVSALAPAAAAGPAKGALLALGGAKLKVAAAAVLAVAVAAGGAGTLIHCWPEGPLAGWWGKVASGPTGKKTKAHRLDGLPQHDQRK
jgi:RNA polymerase sigma factor (sigma-70 family)